MLGERLRCRGYGFGAEKKEEEKEEEESSGEHNNGLLSYGNNDAVNGAKLGGGYKTAAFFDYPQGVINLTKIVQVAVGSGTPLALDDEGRVYSFANGEVGNGGIGDAGVEMFDPTQVTGGVPLYPEAELSTKKEAWTQMRGPVGPKLPTKREYEREEATWYVVAVDSSASHSLVLTNDGRSLGWGSNNSGALANGWSTGAAGDSKRASNEKLATTLSSELSTASAITSLPVALLKEKDTFYGTGQPVFLTSGEHKQTFFTSEAVELGGTGITAIPVVSLKPNFKYPIGTTAALPIYPQMAPFWALKEGPPQSETGKNARGVALVSGTEGTPGAVWSYDSPWGEGTGANILTGIDAIAAGEHTSFFLKGDEVWYSGQPGGAGADERLYAAKDEKWEPTNPAHLPAGYHVTAIAATKGGYLLLLSNGTTAQNLTRYVGYIREYCAGDGKKQSAKTTVREVATPSTSAGVPLKGVIAIAKGEYSCKFLRLDGFVWTCGSNAMLAQGLGKNAWEPCEYATEIPGIEAIAISSTGEGVLGPPVVPPAVPGYIGAGVNGGDMTALLLKGRTVVQFGFGFLPSTGAGAHWEGIGSLGPGDSDNHSTPIVPLNLTKVIQACAGCVQSMVIQEPGEPGKPTLSATCPAPGSVLVKWAPPPGAVGELPNWRAAEGYEVKLTRPTFTSLSFTAAASTREHIFTGVAAGTWTVVVNEKQTAVEPAFNAGLTLTAGKWIGTGSGGKLAVGWVNPTKNEPRWILEWHHSGTYVDGKGNIKEEDWTRCSPDPVGAARAYTIPIVESKNGIAGETIEAVVYGYFSGRKGQTEGAYKKRQRQVVVT
jgi:hypothetical protein